MRPFTTVTRAAGLALCAAVFAGSALADPGNGNGNGNGGTPPGQERKAEQQAPAAPPATTPAAAPATAQQATAPGQAKKAEKTEAKADAKAKAEQESQTKTEAKPEARKQAGPPAKASSSGSYKNTSSGTDLKKGMSHKHTICHATGSESNPYVVITPSVSGVYNGHMDHQGDEDIIPPFTYKGVQYSQNWDAAGQAIFANGCRPPAPPASTTPQPHRQTDACPNIEGMQTTVPTGLVKDAHGNCVAPAGSASVHTTTVERHETVERRDSTVTAAEKKTVEAVASGVLGATSPAAAAAKAAARQPKQAKSGVLGAVAGAPESIAETATTGTLPFTGIPLWLVAILGGGLLAGGFALRRAAQH